MAKDDIEEAEVLAQKLLEAGMAFRTKKAGGYWRRKMKSCSADKEAPLPVYDPEQIRDLRLTPSDLLKDQIREMLLAKHEAHQARRAQGKTPSQEFYAGKAWQALRYQVISERGNKCECCGATPEHGVRLDVDHIKPRSKYPELALEKSNLQVLCQPCNMGKSNRHEDDWRKRKRVLVKQ